jgi:hypothetical protein
MCGEPVQEGDITLTITRWFYAHPNQEHSYPIIAGNRLAHINCVARQRCQFGEPAPEEVEFDDDSPEVVNEEIKTNLCVCNDNFYHFNQYEQEALRDFNNIFRSGRVLTDRQRHFLQRMATFATKKEQEIAEGVPQPPPKQKQPDVLRAEQILAGLGPSYGEEYSELPDYLSLDRVKCLLPKRLVCFESEQRGFQEPMDLKDIRVMLERWNYVFLSTRASFDMNFDESMAMQVAADLIEEFVDLDPKKLEDLNRQKLTWALNRKLKVMDIRTKGRMVIRGIQLVNKLDPKEIKRIMRTCSPKNTLDLYWYARLGVYSAVDPVLEAFNG